MERAIGGERPDMKVVASETSRFRAPVPRACGNDLDLQSLYVPGVNFAGAPRSLIPFNFN
jgi:hypothetical protein